MLPSQLYSRGHVDTNWEHISHQQGAVPLSGGICLGLLPHAASGGGQRGLGTRAHLMGCGFGLRDPCGSLALPAPLPGWLGRH